MESSILFGSTIFAGDYVSKAVFLESELDKRARTVLKTDRSVMSWLGGRTYTLRIFYFRLNKVVLIVIICI